MNKPYGFRGAIKPKAASDNLTDSFVVDGIEISVKEGLFEVGFDSSTQDARAKEVASHLINGWRLRNNVKIEVDFNQKWEPGITGRLLSIELNDTIHVTDRVVTTTATIKGMAYIIKPHSDSYSFSNDIDITRKALKDKTLADALHYYSEEVVDDKRPLYGVYKALEVITSHLGKDGREKLGLLAGKTKSYVDDVMQTTQVQRHAITLGKRKLSDQECKERASLLIGAYANCISL